MGTLWPGLTPGKSLNLDGNVFFPRPGPEDGIWTVVPEIMFERFYDGDEMRTIRWRRYRLMKKVVA